MIEISLKNRKALITGGARGIGASICKIFSECGADVAFTYANSENIAKNLVEELKQNGGNALSFQALAQDRLAMEMVVNETARAFGGLDIIVANAAWGKACTIEDTSYEDWQKGIEVNLTAPFMAIKLVYPLMCQAPRGDVLLIGSSAAYDGGGRATFYATAKAGMGGMVRRLMRELSQKNIRINVIHPCVVDTEGFRRGHDTPEKLEKERLRVPLGRLSKPEDVAYLAAFLCSDLGEHITGQSFLVDGGRTLWKKDQI